MKISACNEGLCNKVEFCFPLYPLTSSHALWLTPPKGKTTQPQLRRTMASITAIGSPSNTSCFRPSKAASSDNKKAVVTRGSTQKCNFEASSSDDSGTMRLSPIQKVSGRRNVLLASTLGILSGCIVHALDELAIASEFADMPALRGKDYGKSKMRYPDYTETKSGLQYKDLRLGDGPIPKVGQRVVVDWDGYTIGYYGRIFEARNKTKGGSFEGDDKAFFKFTVGSNQVIPAFEEAIKGMASGGIRRIIVPPELGYPDNDYNKLGPKPTTFSGQRALDFVLRNQGLIDKTLLFDIELVKVIQD